MFKKIIVFLLLMFPVTIRPIPEIITITISPPFICSVEKIVKVRKVSYFSKVNTPMDIKIKKSEVFCLAANIFYEAQGETFFGKLSVAYVTYNRKKDWDFPNTYCGVVYEPYQFSWVYSVAYKEAYPFDPSKEKFSVYIDLANNFLVHEDPTYGSLYFHNTKLEPFWASVMEEKITIGEHIFYKKLDKQDIL